VILVKSYVVKASVIAHAVETVIDAENELEAQAKALALLREKLAQVKELISVEVRGEYVPRPDKGDYLLQK
jgi:hypothetical protein